ncbi:MAG: hypothetical protein C3F13_04120 [Anaerolineales bacterium]|nr:MAG: hypothetical protein C3F13_04120 [Anaerolineales bacterium]
MKSQGKLVLLVIVGADLLIILALLGIRLINNRSTAKTTPQVTPSVENVPGLVVYGSVRGQNGEGIAGVTVYRQYASYPGVVIATTDGSGYYKSDFYGIPGDEMVSVWAEMSGLKLLPERCSWRHYYGSEVKACDFVAQSLEVFYFPLVFK